MDRPFPAYKGDGSYIFVSYSHADSIAVFQELSLLNESGLHIWYDEGIEAGTEWREEIGHAIKNSGLFLYFVTSNSVRSENCRNELNFAVDENVPVLTIYLEQTELTDGLKLVLSSRQAILKHDIAPDEYITKLFDGIRKHIPDTDVIVPVIPKPGLAKRLLRSRSLWIVTGLVAIGVLLMSVSESRNWITQTAIGLAFNAAVIFSSQALTIETGIAVLPFANMSNDPDNEYFSDGISEEILNALVKANRMNVIARTSSFSFKGKDIDIKEIGRALGVTHVLEGSVRKVNNNVRITAQLIDAATGAHLWAETYDRELLDVFAIQDEIASEVVKQIGIELMTVLDTAPGVVSSRGTSSSLAYEFYLRATTLMNSGNPFEIEKAIVLFEQAIALDREYVDAWVGLGYTYTILAGQHPGLRFPDEIQPLGIEAMRTALELDPANARAMGALGWLLICQEYEWKKGAELMRQSLALNPLDAQIQATYGFFLMITRQPEATSVIEKAYRLNPLDPLVIFVKSGQLFNAGRLFDAMALTETVLIQDREGYRANIQVAANTAPFRLEMAEERLARARDIVGPDYSEMRVADLFFAMFKKDSKLVEEIRTELFERARHAPVPNLVQIPWKADQVVEMWDLAVKHRYIEVIPALFQGKPFHMPETDWQRIKTLTRVAEADIGLAASVGPGRTDDEREKLRAAAVTLPGEDWALYSGEYQEIGGIRKIFFTRDGGLLRFRLITESEEIVSELIPQGNHRFERLDFKSSWEFIMENSKVTQMTAHPYVGSDVEFLKVE